MKATILLLIFLGDSVAAAEIYKCRAADGSISFQQAQCVGAPQLGQQSYARQPDAPHEQYVPSRAGTNEQGVQAAATGGGPHPAGAKTRESPREAAAFSCSDGRRTWVQTAPCPSTTTRVVADAFSGTTVHGTPVHGTVARRVNTPVGQSELNKSEMCEKLSKWSLTSSKKQRESDASYERNKMRRELGC